MVGEYWWYSLTLGSTKDPKWGEIYEFKWAIVARGVSVSFFPSTEIKAPRLPPSMEAADMGLFIF